MIALSVYYERSAFKSVLRMCADRPALPATDFVSKTSYTKSFQISVQIQFANVYRVNITFGRAYVSGVLISSLLTWFHNPERLISPRKELKNIGVVIAEGQDCTSPTLLLPLMCDPVLQKSHNQFLRESPTTKFMW